MKNKYYFIASLSSSILLVTFFYFELALVRIKASAYHSMHREHDNILSTSYKWICQWHGAREQDQFYPIHVTLKKNWKTISLKLFNKRLHTDSLIRKTCTKWNGAVTKRNKDSIGQSVFFLENNLFESINTKRIKQTLNNFSTIIIIHDHT